MKSLSLVEPGKFTFKDIPAPTLKPNQTLVDVLACGVCGSDIHAMHGKQPFFSYPRILGHELCVRVSQCHPQDSHEPGDQCIVEPYFFCGKCSACKQGKTNCCVSLQVMGIHFDGGHAPMLSVSSQYLHKANGLSVEQAALVEPLAIGEHAVSRTNPEPNEKLLILGMGTIGIAAAMMSIARGVTPLVVDIDTNRLAKAMDILGVESGLLAGPELASEVTAHFGQLADCIIDATGNQTSMNGCVDLLEYGARVVFVGVFSGEMALDTHRFIERELTMLASRAALSSDFQRVISLIEDGTINPLGLISDRLEFSELDNQLLSLTEKPDLMKAIINY